MRTFGKVLAVLGIVVLLLVVTGVTFAAWTVHRSFPQTSGTVSLQGLSGNVDPRHVPGRFRNSSLKCDRSESVLRYGPCSPNSTTETPATAQARRNRNRPTSMPRS